MSRLQIVWTVTSKELLDFVRDWRTLAAMLLVPLILFPIIFVAVPMFLQGEAEELGEYSVSVQLLIEEDEYNPNELIQLLNSTLVIVQYSNITFDENKSLSDHETLRNEASLSIRNGEFDSNNFNWLAKRHLVRFINKLMLNNMNLNNFFRFWNNGLY